VGDFEVPLALFLQAATPRDTLARLLRNLKEIHRSAGATSRWLAVQRRLVILLPDEGAEQRDLALALAAAGETRAAADALTLYLRQCPDASDAPALQARLAAWTAGDAGAPRRAAARRTPPH
jgi:regulator of sirC expression with transglutaminase-like and TPR domain